MTDPALDRVGHPHGAPYPRPRPWQRAFLSALAQVGVVTWAAQAAGVARSTVYAARDRDRRFAEGWAEALEEAVDRLELEARRRAVDGVPEPIVVRGRPVGIRLRYSDSLLMLLLKGARPERYRDRVEVEVGSPSVVEVEDPAVARDRLRDLIRRSGRP